MFVYKYRNRLLIIILLIGFALRFYSAVSLPANWDEEEALASIEKQFFNTHNIGSNLVKENSDTFIFGSKIMVYLGWILFGDSLLGARIPFVICGTLIILIVYFFVKFSLGVQKALLSSFLLSISQYDIGMTRYVESAFLVLFVIISLFLFYKSLLQNNRILLLLSGVSIGVGFLFKENAIVLIPVYLVFLLSCRRYRFLLKSKYLWISLGFPFLIIVPVVYQSFVYTSRFAYLSQAVRVGWSINAIAVYLGELILLLLKPFGDFYNYVVSSLDSQFPMVNFLFGGIILIAVGKSVLDKRPFIRLLVICFLFNFVPFMFLRGGTEEIDSFWCLSNLDWSILNFIPGVILASSMLGDLMIRCHNKYKVLLFTLFFSFILLRTFHFVSLPLSYCFPAMDHSLELQFEARGIHYLEKGDKEKAKDVFERIYDVASDGSYYKIKSALLLSEILIKENKHEESKGYLYYVLSQNPENKKALRLLQK
jgi:4-amino-4-deoxy-L-arabinose transferase-like glycosyltransferase